MPRKAAGALRGIDYLAAIAEKALVFFQLGFQQLCITADHSQQIVEVMCNAAGQPAQGLHFLRLEKLCLQFALFRAVKLHAKDTFLVANTHQGGKIQAHMLKAGRVLEFDFQILQ